MAATAVAMPRLGMTMEEGTVVSWAVAPGGAITKGETVVVIESEKAESEVEATASGVLRHVYVEPGTTVPCGALLAAITPTAAEPFDAEAFAAEHASPPPRADAVAPRAAARVDAAGRGGRARAGREGPPVSPAARRAARQLGVDLARVAGSGPGGRVQRRDVEAAAAAAERLVPVEEGVRLEVLREGEGEPVVLLPGFGSDVASFALVTGMLVRDFQVLGVNPRGVGHSDAPDLPRYEVARAAQDVATLLDGPAHVAGASLGAAVALELALAHPERVRSLALLTPFVEATPRLLAVAEAWCRVAEEAGPETLARMLAPWLFGDALLADEAALARTLRGLGASLRRVPAPTLRRSREGMAAWSGRRRDALGRVTAPTLVVAGERDLLVPDASSLASCIPGARATVVPGAGHAVAVDAPEAVAEALRGHLTASP